jgi:N-acetylglucosaminylphosphatidylinositol deacetylase
LETPVIAFSLSSISLLRKFTFILDGPISYFINKFSQKSMVLMASPSDYLKARRAMFAHSSQLVWFRHLYIAFSRYMVINSLQNMQNIDESK